MSNLLGTLTHRAMRVYRSPMKYGTTAFLVLALLSTGPKAYAQDRAAAREHFQKGTKAFELSLYDEAITEYMAAYKAKDDPAFLYNIAQAHRLADHPAEALRFYRSYLHKLPGASNRPEVERKIEELQRLVDQQKKAQTNLPPDHTIKPQVTAAQESAPREVSTEPAPVPAAANGSGRGQSDASPEQPGRTKRIAGIAVAGVGLAAVATGIAFGVLAKSAADDLSKSSLQMQPFDKSKEQAGQRDQILEGVFLGVGAAAVVTGVVVLVLGYREGPSSTAVSFAPSVSGRGANASLSFHF